MEVACRLHEKAKLIEGPSSHAVHAVASALEVIPRTLAQNCGADVVRTITGLRSCHGTKGSSNIGIDGTTGQIVDCKEAKVLDGFAVKSQSIRSSIETAAMLLRIDQIVSGVSGGRTRSTP